MHYYIGIIDVFNWEGIIYFITIFNIINVTVWTFCFNSLDCYDLWPQTNGSLYWFLFKLKLNDKELILMYIMTLCSRPMVQWSLQNFVNHICRVMSSESRGQYGLLGTIGSCSKSKQWQCITGCHNLELCDERKQLFHLAADSVLGEGLEIIVG